MLKSFSRPSSQTGTQAQEFNQTQAQRASPDGADKTTFSRVQLRRIILDNTPRQLERLRAQNRSVNMRKWVCAVIVFMGLLAGTVRGATDQGDEKRDFGAGHAPIDEKDQLTMKKALLDHQFRFVGGHAWPQVNFQELFGNKAQVNAKINEIVHALSQRGIKITDEEILVGFWGAAQYVPKLNKYSWAHQGPVKLDELRSGDKIKTGVEALRSMQGKYGKKHGDKKTKKPYSYTKEQFLGLMESFGTKNVTSFREFETGKPGWISSLLDAKATCGFDLGTGSLKPWIKIEEDGVHECVDALYEEFNFKELSGKENLGNVVKNIVTKIKYINRIHGCTSFPFYATGAWRENDGKDTWDAFKIAMDKGIKKAYEENIQSIPEYKFNRVSIENECRLGGLSFNMLRGVTETLAEKQYKLFVSLESGKKSTQMSAILLGNNSVGEGYNPIFNTEPIVQEEEEEEEEDKPIIAVAPVQHAYVARNCTKASFNVSTRKTGTLGWDAKQITYVDSTEDYHEFIMHGLGINYTKKTSCGKRTTKFIQIKRNNGIWYNNKARDEFTIALSGMHNRVININEGDAQAFYDYLRYELKMELRKTTYFGKDLPQEPSLCMDLQVGRRRLASAPMKQLMRKIDEQL